MWQGEHSGNNVRIRPSFLTNPQPNRTNFGRASKDWMTMLLDRFMTFVVDMTALALTAAGIFAAACLAFPPLPQFVLRMVG